MEEVEFYFGLGSRYSYLAFTQLARIEATYNCRFSLHPISSVDLMALRGRSPFEGAPVSGQYDWDYRRRDAEAWAEYYRVPFMEPHPLPDDHRLMARACHAAGQQNTMRDYCAALFTAIFVDHVQIDVAACIAIGASIGIEAQRLRLAIGSSEVEASVTQAARSALLRGAFGVPTLFACGRMFWGNDRLVLLEDLLRRRSNHA